MQPAVLQQLLQHLPDLLLAACSDNRMHVFVNLAALAAVVAAHEEEQGNLQPQQLQPVLQALVQSASAGTGGRAMSVIYQLMRNAQVRVQLCEQAATQLPALLDVMDRSWAACTAVLQITSAAYHSTALQQALREHAGEALAALQQQLDGVIKAAQSNDNALFIDSCRLTVNNIQYTLLWLLWESNGGQAAAAAGGAGIEQEMAAGLLLQAAVGAAAAAAGADFIRELGNALLLSAGCTLHWPPHNVQLLQHPALLDCMLMLATRLDSAAFAMLFVSRIVAASEEAALLLSPQRMQHMAAAVEALAAGSEQLRQQQGPGGAGSGTHCHMYKSLVKLLQCMTPLSASRKGLLVLTPHAQVLQTAAAALQHELSEDALFWMRLDSQQVLACRQWAEQTAATAVTAMQETTAEHAEAVRLQRWTLFHHIAPAYGADMRAFAVAMNRFVRATARVEHLQQLLLPAGVVAGAEGLAA
jgi:hypothetical protein